MIRAYCIEEDESKGEESFYVNACHSLALPGVVCPRCGPWSSTGISYPSVDNPQLRDLLKATDGPVDLETYRTLSDQVLRHMSDVVPVEPGAKFGPLAGTLTGNAGDIAWGNPWTPLMRQSLVREARENGIELVAGQCDLVYKRTKYRQLMEIEAVPTIRCVPEDIPGACSICGRTAIVVPHNIRVIGASIDPDVPLCRIFEMPTVLVANERFVNWVDEKKLSGLLVHPVEIV